MSNAAKIVAIAKGEVGYHEGKSGGHWNNRQKYSPTVPGLEWSQNQAWCATFVSWCALEADVADLYPRTASCLTGVSWFKSRKRFSEYPAVGAQIFFGSGGGSHTGLVYDYDDDYVYTIEGNTNTSGGAEGDGVYLKKRRRRDSYVYGYGYPKFTDGIKSADPAYADEAPKPPAPKPPTQPHTYTVKEGDVLSSIGVDLRIKWQTIASLNGISAPYVITVGQVLKLPTTSTKPTTPTKPAVDLSNVVAAAKRDPGLAQGRTTHAADVKIVESALKAEGLLPARYASDGSFGSMTVAAYKAWQKRCGYTGTDADGIPGKFSLKRLGTKHGFTVKA